MNKVLCSSGAIIGRANNNDYRLLKEYVPKLDCDGIELMMSSSWYSDIETVIKSIKSYNIDVPVIHSQKSLGEALCGMTASYENGLYSEHIMTEEEDAQNFKNGTDRFVLNLRLAEGLGADRMVLHLWNGIASDKNIEKNIERYAVWKELAQKAGVDLLVENVICNTKDPLYNVGLVAKKYEDAGFVYDTKMAEFHEQTMDLFRNEYEWIVKNGQIRHLHINDYGGGYMDWANMSVLPIGKGHVDFEAFFKKLSDYEYRGDFTVESTALSREGVVDFDMLNICFEKLRQLLDKYII